ncbi:MAG: T9SS type A sorting domain-containing protein [Hymenobacter sp.]|nr:MAG: T9SS type A sorting domain-containing protein [Hymenobacter sp.]
MFASPLWCCLCQGAWCIIPEAGFVAWGLARGVAGLWSCGGRAVGICLVLLFGLCTPSVAQQPLPAPAWRLAAALDNPLVPFATATDEQGDVYVAGSFYDSLRLGAFRLRSVGGEDGFVAKWRAATHTFEWVQQVSGPQTERVLALAVAQNRVYLVGSSSSGQAQVGSLSLLSQGAVGNDNVFVTRLTASGPSSAFTWVQTLGSHVTTASTVAVHDSSVYVGGSFYGAATFGRSVLADRHANQAGGANGFLAKFTDTGRTARCEWAQPVGVGVGALAVSAAGVYLAGAYQGGQAEFDNLTLPSYGSGNLYIAKLRDAGSQGSLTWVQHTGDLQLAWVSGLAVVDSSLYVGGTFFGRTLRFGPTLLTNVNHGHGTDIFLAKLTDGGSSSRFSWAQQAGGAGQDECQGLAANETGVYLTGTFSSAPATFGPCQVLNKGGADTFVAHLTDAGRTASFTWAQSVGGPANDRSWSMALSGPRVYVAATLPSATPIQLATGSLVQGAFLGVLESPPASPSLADPGVGEVALYPNPAQELVTVHLPPQAAPRETTFQLYDAQGRLIRAFTQQVPVTGLDQQWTLHGLSKGLYVLRVQAGATTTSQRLVVE